MKYVNCTTVMVALQTELPGLSSLPGAAWLFTLAYGSAETRHSGTWEQRYSSCRMGHPLCVVAQEGHSTAPGSGEGLLFSSKTQARIHPEVNFPTKSTCAQ